MKKPDEKGGYEVEDPMEALDAFDAEVGVDASENKDRKERGKELVGTAMKKVSTGWKNFRGYLGGKLKGFGEKSADVLYSGVGFAEEDIKNTAEDARAAKNYMKEDYRKTVADVKGDISKTVEDAKWAKDKIVGGVETAVGAVTDKITKVKERGQDAYAKTTKRIGKARDGWNDFINKGKLAIKEARLAKGETALDKSEAKLQERLLKTAELRRVRDVLQQEADEIRSKFSYNREKEKEAVAEPEDELKAAA